MRLPKLLFALIVLILLPMQAIALGLGSMKVHSALNQPLDADIQLLSVGSTPLSEIAVKVASNEAFAKIGLSKPFFLTKLQFELATNKKGQPIVLVTTKDAVVEPYMSVLLELSWPGGQVFREYTMLFDPPKETRQVAFNAKTTPIVASPLQKSKNQQQLYYGPTVNTDHLWRIALSVRPGAMVTTEQVMIAILKANPNAFIDNNVNRLKPGVVLSIPDATTMQNTSANTALNDVKQQNKAWHGMQKSMLAASSKGLEQKAPTFFTKPQGDTKIALTTTTQQTSPQKTQTVQLQPTNATIEQSLGQQLPKKPTALQAELAVTAEQLQRYEQANEVMQVKMQRLEEQNSKLEALIKQQQTQISSLESSITAKIKEAMLQVIDSAEAEVGDSAAQASGSDIIKPNNVLKLIIAAVVVILLAILALLVIRRRRRAQSQHESDDYESDDDELSLDDGLFLEEERRVEHDDDDSADFEPAHDDSDDIIHEPHNDMESAVTPEPPLGDVQLAQEIDEELSHHEEEQTEAPAEETDALEEASIYIAYERYQQAIVVIQHALETQPQRAELWAKLLEIYRDTEDTDNFDSTTAQLSDDMKSNADIAILIENRVAQDSAVAVEPKQVSAEQDMMGNVVAVEEVSTEEVAALEEVSIEDLSIDVAEDHQEVEQSQQQDDEQDRVMTFEVKKEQQPATSLAEAEEENESNVLSFDLSSKKEPQKGSDEFSIDDELANLDLQMQDISVSSTEPSDIASAESAEQGDDIPEIVIDDSELVIDDDELEQAMSDNLEFQQQAEAADVESAESESQPDPEDIGSLAGGGDVVATKLDLIRAYIDMGDTDGAKEILDEILQEGNEQQKQEARRILAEISGD